MSSTQPENISETEFSIVKRGRGRPAGVKNNPDTNKKTRVITGTIGRPLRYGVKAEDGTILKNDLSTYERRGFLVNKILGLKKNYNLSYPDKSEYIGKDNSVIVEILKKMAIEVQKVKMERNIDKLIELNFRIKLI